MYPQEAEKSAKAGLGRARKENIPSCEVERGR